VKEFGKVAAMPPRAESGGVMFPPVENELFYFGETVEKFALHKAGRIVGCFKAYSGRVFVPCFRIQYPDGEIAHAPFVEQSQGAFEMLDYDSAVFRYGEDAFK
jgi:hypothetical protein